MCDQEYSCYHHKNYVFLLWTINITNIDNDRDNDEPDNGDKISFWTEGEFIMDLI